jgi:F-type H+-transporting ATPase subunit b
MLATFALTTCSAAGAAITTSSHAAEGGVNLDMDATLFVQAAFILVLWLVLKPVLFDPMLKLFEEREKRIEGAVKKARRIDEKSAAANAEYEELVAQGRAAGAAERDKLRTDAARKESDLLGKIRSQTQQRVDAARAETEKELAQTRSQLVPHTNAIAKDLAKRVLGREVTG